MVRNIRDALLIKEIALPNGAATVNSPGLDLEQSSRADFCADAELLIEAPAVAVGPLADGQTLKYSVMHDTDPAFGTVVALYPDVLTQTGAGGAGAAAATLRVGVPSNIKSQVRLKIVKSGAGDASGVKAKLSLVF